MRVEIQNMVMIILKMINVILHIVKREELKSLEHQVIVKEIDFIEKININKPTYKRKNKI